MKPGGKWKVTWLLLCLPPLGTEVDPVHLPSGPDRSLCREVALITPDAGREED